MQHLSRIIALLCIIITVYAGYQAAPKTMELTILFTNDTHSQVLPNSSDQGGYARRMGLIQQERKQNTNVLLLDAGDFSQGTPYFNYFHGRIEIDALNRMGYDAVTLGNHEFDNGIDTLATILQQAHFPVVCANYDVTGTALEGLIKPYTIVKRQGIKIGIFGISVQPGSLIAKKNIETIRFLHPYTIAQETANILRQKEHCDLVICLSHQGTYAEHEGDYNDYDMVTSTTGIDVVIGGHTHEVYDNLTVANKNGQPVVVAQMGKAGRKLGKTTLNLVR